MKNKITFLWVHPSDENYVKEHFSTAKIFHDIPQWEKLTKEVWGTEILSCLTIHKLKKEVLEKLWNLKAIFTRSVGFDHIDLDFCREKWIKVCNVPDYGSHIISEHVFALILSEARHVIEWNRRTKEWHFACRKDLKWISLRGKTLWIIWTGKIWIQTARIASLGFRMNTIAYDKFENKTAAEEMWFTYTSFEEVLKQSDIISIHAPLLPETFHLIDKKAIKKMKDWVILINTSRWELVDSEALIEWLESGKIRFAWIDVIENESKPELSEKLLKMHNLIATPHIWAFTDEAVKTQFDVSFANIKRFLNWEKLENQVV